MERIEASPLPFLRFEALLISTWYLIACIVRRPSTTHPRSGAQSDNLIREQLTTEFASLCALLTVTSTRDQVLDVLLRYKAIELAPWRHHSDLWHFSQVGLLREELVAAFCHRIIPYFATVSLDLSHSW